MNRKHNNILIIKRIEESNKFNYKNKDFSEIKNESLDTNKKSNNTKINHCYNIISKNPRNKGKEYLTINIIHLMNCINIIKYILLLILYNNIFADSKISLIEYKSYKITLRIKGTGTRKVFSDNSMFSSKYYPNEVYINGYNQTEVKKYYNLYQVNNFVELIWYNLINNCSYMFSDCSFITEIDFSYFNTSKIEKMLKMFFNCKSLVSINFSNFDTSKVENTNDMFNGCSSLTSLNLSNFDTSKVTLMFNMFYYCSSLTSLNLSNFNTSQVTSMSSMFYYCSSLTSLDLSKFNTSLVSSMYDIFVGCSNLVYINMINFEENRLDSLSQYSGMLKDVTENIVICINNFTAQPKIIPQINEITCHVIDCANDWKSKQKKIINDTNECIQSCVNSSLYKYEYNGKCYENCKQGFLNDDNNIQTNKCKCELDKCLSCPNIALNKGLCEKCNINYYPKENDPLNLGEYINCYKELEGYYLDNNIFKQCYYSCKTCNISGNIKNHNCLECNENYTYEINNSNYINCYENCSYYHYFDDEYNYYCTKNSSCPYKYPKLNKDKMECFKISINDMIEDLMINKKNETEKLTKEEEIEFYDNLFQIIEKGFTDNYNTTKLDNGQDEIITTDKMIVTFTTSQNQKNNINNNMTTIDLGECETLLKNELVMKHYI